MKQLDLKHYRLDFLLITADLTESISMAFLSNTAY